MHPKKSIWFGFTILIVALVVWILTGQYYKGREGQYYELTRIADNYKTDKGALQHHYTQLYECLFSPMRLSAKKIFEIGVLEGASLKMFAEYFPSAAVYGIDIKDTSHLNSERIKTFIADQANRTQLNSFIAKYGNDFDIILDDGGHSMEQQQVSLAFLFKDVKPGGYYVLEDVHTSLIPEYGVIPDESNSTLTMINQFVRTGKIISKYMSEEEMQFLNDNISSCNLFSTDKGASITCVFKRKPLKTGERILKLL
jgi:predicted O-methyltransferase YrrM